MKINGQQRNKPIDVLALQFRQIHEKRDSYHPIVDDNRLPELSYQQVRRTLLLASEP